MKNLWKNRTKGQIGIAICVCWLLICLFFTPIYTTLTLTFAEDPSGEVVTTAFTGIGENIKISDAKNRVVNSGVGRFYYWDLVSLKSSNLKRLDPIDQYYKAEEALVIEKIEVTKNGISTLSLEKEELMNCFTGNEQVILSEDTSKGLEFSITGDDPQLLPTEYFQSLYQETPVLVKLLSCILLTGILICFYLLIRWLRDILKNATTFETWTTYVFAGSLIVLLGMTIHVALRSPFWANPDEYDVKAAVLYYFHQFFPPDIRSDSINDSYPVYGTSRHFEWNLFYFCAGKIGQFCTDATLQLRAFTLLIFSCMTGMVLKNIKRNQALLCTLLLTPQVWYIFSYSTSDALDFFVGFLCLYQLIEDNSILHRLLREDFQRKHILYYGVLSFLFVNLFWAKVTFYPMLLFIFLILLIHLCFLEKEKKKKVLQKYLLLVGLTLLIFFIRYMITDYPYYGFSKAQVIIDVTNLRAEYAYKYSTPAFESAYSMRFFEKGVSLKELLTEFDFHKNLFRTFSGFFGSYEFGAADWYYIAMGGLYSSLIGYILYHFKKMKEKKLWWEFGAATTALILQYIMIVGNSWFVDFQPQGRYLLPALFYITYLVSRLKNKKEDKILQVILLCTGMLSLYCFYKIGIGNLIPIHGIQG